MADRTLVTVSLDADTMDWLAKVATEQGRGIISAAEWAIERQRELWQSEGQQDGPGEEEPA